MTKVLPSSWAAQTQGRAGALWSLLADAKCNALSLSILEAAVGIEGMPDILAAFERDMPRLTDGMRRAARCLDAKDLQHFAHLMKYGALMLGTAQQADLYDALDLTAGCGGITDVLDIIPEAAARYEDMVRNAIAIWRRSASPRTFRATQVIET